MRYYLTALITSLIIITSNAQLKVKDANTNKPISNVKVFSKKGEILGISNLKGIIKISKKLKAQVTDTLEIFHPNYFSKKIVWSNVDKNLTVHLDSPPITKLDEVIIKTKKIDYVILKGTFISYQLVDNIPISFTDGIIEYHINLQKKKLIKTKITKVRLFKNYPKIKLMSKQKKNTVNTIINTALPFNFKQEVLIADWDKFTITNDSIIRKKNSVIGSLHKNDSESVLSIQYHSPENPKEISLLGIKSKINNEIINERFASKKPRINKIVNINRYYNSNITKKDVSLNYELIDNFYTLEKKEFSKENYKVFLKNNSELKIVNPNLKAQKTPSFITNLLFKELKLIK